MADRGGPPRGFAFLPASTRRGNRLDSRTHEHANGAKRLKQALIVSTEPGQDAAHLGRMIDRDVKTEPDGAMAVPSGIGPRRFRLPHEGPVRPAIS